MKSTAPSWRWLPQRNALGWAPAQSLSLLENAAGEINNGVRDSVEWNRMKMQSRRWIHTCCSAVWKLWEILTKWSFTAHSALWLCGGCLLYSTSLGQHRAQYSHSIHILYICMYTFLPSLRKSVQALLPPILLLSDHCLILHPNKNMLLDSVWETVGVWGMLVYC